VDHDVDAFEMCGVDLSLVRMPFDFRRAKRTRAPDKA
jgi:hypothetical protein